MAASLALHAPLSIKSKLSAQNWKTPIRGEIAIAADPLARLGVPQSLDRGRALFEEGDPAEHYFQVVSGTVRLFKFLVDGRRQIAGFFFPGDFFGWSAGDTYTYSAEAVDPANLVRYSRRSVEALVETHPATARRLIGYLSVELGAAQDQMVLLGRKTAEERLASFLTMMVRRTGKSGQSGAIELSMTRSDIADYLGLTVETVCRTIHALKAAGTIASSGAHNITVLRPQRLLEMAECAESHESVRTH